MKKVFLYVALAFFMNQLWSQNLETSADGTDTQEDRNFRIPLLGEIAPSFTAESTNGTITFPDDFGKKWKILFSHPQDFTPVCASEIMELANLQGEFNALDVTLVVMSTDPLDFHIQWKKAMEQLEYKGRPPVKIGFPLVDDESLAISKKYGMIHGATNTTKDVRGVFILDPENIVRAIYFYPVEVGRSTGELIRTVTALQATYGALVMTPADWRSGDDVLIPYHPGPNVAADEPVPDDYYQLSWFMWYKKSSN